MRNLCRLVGGICQFSNEVDDGLSEGWVANAGVGLHEPHSFLGRHLITVLMFILSWFQWLQPIYRLNELTAINFNVHSIVLCPAAY